MKIIIVGCGRNGSGLAQAMSKAGHSVTVIDSLTRQRLNSSANTFREKQ